MAIIKLTPSCKDYLWGGSRLRTDFGVQSDLDPLAEALAEMDGERVPCMHQNGPFGRTAANAVAVHLF